VVAMGKITKKLRNEIANKLQLTLDKLKELPEELFFYRTFVKTYNEKNQCGTVCCVAGWYPFWFPESGLIWSPKTNGILNTNDGNHIEDKLVSFHKLDEDVILDLFYAQNTFRYKNGFSIAVISFDSKKSEVEQRFSDVIALIRTGKLDNFLLTD
jgi:hypothetical protein